MAQYFIKRGEAGTPKGPLDVATVKKLVAAKKVVITDLISPDKKKWFPVTKVQGLFPKQSAEEFVEIKDETKNTKKKKSLRRKSVESKTSKKKLKEESTESPDYNVLSTKSKANKGAGSKVLSFILLLVTICLIVLIAGVFYLRTQMVMALKNQLDQYQQKEGINLAYDNLSCDWFGNITADNIKRTSPDILFSADSISVGIGYSGYYEMGVEGKTLANLSSIQVNVQNLQSKKNEVVTKLKTSTFILAGAFVENTISGEIESLYENFNRFSKSE